MQQSCSERCIDLLVPTEPLADSCVVCGHHPPRFLFFAASGSMCNIAQLGMDRLLLEALALASSRPADEEPRWWEPTVCWTLSYTLSVSLRHMSHSWCVFGRHADAPCKALGKTYITYLSTIVASTALNLLLVSVMLQSHDVALVTTATFSVAWSCK